MASPYPFVEATFSVPAGFATDDFRIRMLTVNDVIKDYDAVMSSVEELKSRKPEANWPEGLTLEENLIDLGWHQREFLNRDSFTYTVVSLDESKVLGCVYIYPTRKINFDAEVYSWVRETPLGVGMDSQLHNAVRVWLTDTWPFGNVAYPGREIDWDTWQSVAEEKR